jgi:hypothetical protein
MTGPFTTDVERLISNFRELPENRSSLRDAGTKPFDSILETCIERYHIGRKTPEEAIMEHWERIVGGPFAKRCRPERIDRGALVIQVPNTTLRRELMFLEGRILTAVGSIPECQHIHRIVLKGGH